MTKPTPLQTRRGFTLIELMIAVAIIAILAAVAGVAFANQAKSARSKQAHAFLGAITANQAGRNPFIGLAAPNFCPGTVGAGAVDWDAACNTVMWNQLGVTPPRQTYYQYTVVSGGPGDDCTARTGNAAFCTTWTNGDRWWVAIARGDLDGDGTFSTFITSYSLGGVIIETDPRE